MDQLITATLDLLKSIVVNDNISDSGYESKNNSKTDISVKITLDIIVKKKNASDLKVIK